MSRRRHVAEHGAWHLVPLTDGGFGLAVVAHPDPGFAFLGIYFGPRIASESDLPESLPSPETAVCIVITFDDCIRNGRWPYAGRTEALDFDMPVFVSRIGHHQDLVTCDPSNYLLAIPRGQRPPGDHLRPVWGIRPPLSVEADLSRTLASVRSGSQKSSGEELGATALVVSPSCFR